MRKLSLIKNIGLSLSPLAIIAPVVITATSCGTSQVIKSNYISFNTILDESSCKSMKTGRFSRDSLLLGNKKFFKGNYILFIGSNAFPDKENDGKTEQSRTMKFFAGTNGNRDVKTWFNESFEESIWFNDVINSTVIKTHIDKDFGFVTYIDDFDFKFYDSKKHEIFVTDDASKLIAGIVTNVGPFETWGKTGRIQQTRDLNKRLFDYEWDKDEKVKDTDYIRQDSSAKAFRAFIERAAAMFPKTKKRTKTFDKSTDGLMVIYKDGQLKEIVDLPSERKINPQPDDTDKDTKTLFGAINKYFTKEEKKDDK